MNFKKENMDKMLVAIKSGDHPTDYTLVEKQMKNFPDYVNSVAMMEISIPIIKLRNEGEPDKIQYEITRLDKKRRFDHDACIGSCNILNRLANFYKIDPLFEGDLDNRNVVADIAKEITNLYFNNGQREHSYSLETMEEER